jgi:hypothetical protein
MLIFSNSFLHTDGKNDFKRRSAGFQRRLKCMKPARRDNFLNHLKRKNAEAKHNSCTFD